uniref:Myb/SANT-like domain-containing protein n=1 Tax=Lactuca sativa TaxID=4236 RepID=A0A9R1UKD1_LACSA|nr:hypothetical protein LSAT_V11C900489340 [Lactuca sativa]
MDACYLLITCMLSKMYFFMLSIHGSLIYDDMYVIMIKEEQVRKKEQMKWIDWMDYCFIQAMLTQQEKGLRIRGSFIPQAYTNMVEEINQKFGKSFSQWYDIFRGTSLSSFSWNS